MPVEPVKVSVTGPEPPDDYFKFCYYCMKKMKNRLLSIFIFFMVIHYCFGQKVIMQEIYKIKAGPPYVELSLNAKYSVDKDNSKSLEYVNLLGQD